MQDAHQTTRKHPLTTLPYRCALSATVLVIATSAILAADNESAPAHHEISVRIYPSAAVSSDTIRLKDIGRIEGAADATLEDWPIVTGLRPGDSYVVEIDTLQKVLAQRGANLGLWIFRGHSQCRVQRADHGRTRVDPTGETSRETSEYRTADGAAPSASVVSLDATGTPSYLRDVDPNSLDAELRRHIAARLASLGGEPVIRFSTAAQRYLKLTKPTYHFKIADDCQRLLGMVSFQVTILEGDLVRQTTQILAEIILEKQVVVAKRLMNRGHVITARDVELRAFPFKNLNDVQFTDLQPLIGQRARKLIDQGAQISPRDIEPVPLVQRNDLVTVWVRRGNLVIKSTAKAMDAAGYGEPVELKNAQTREYFTGIVTGVRTVELPAPKHDAALALADTRDQREKR